MDTTPDTPPSPEKQQVLFEQKVFNWVAGIASGLIVLGTTVVGSLLWTTNSSVVALTAKVESLQTSVNDLKTQSSATDAKKSEISAIDKASLVALINTTTTNYTELLSKVSERLTAQERLLTDLRVELARSPKPDAK